MKGEVEPCDLQPNIDLYQKSQNGGTCFDVNNINVAMQNEKGVHETVSADDCFAGDKIYRQH